jgi:hypothetical protein
MLLQLDEELKILNVRGEVFIVGGAAMAIAYDTRRATADVDSQSGDVLPGGWPTRSNSLLRSLAVLCDIRWQPPRFSQRQDPGD